MHTKSSNVEIMTGSETDEIIEDLFESFLQKYEEGFMNLNNLNKVSLSRDGSYIDSPKWLKTKRQQ